MKIVDLTVLTLSPLLIGHLASRFIEDPMLTLYVAIVGAVAWLLLWLGLRRIW